MKATAASRKAAQRRRDKLLGWAEVTVRVPATRAEDLRAYAASFPPPAPLTDPNQLDLLAQIEAEMNGDDPDAPRLL